MDDRAAEIIEEWRRRRPPLVPKEEVARVVAAVFPRGTFRLYEDVGGVKATHRARTVGSHFLIIEDDLLRWADENGYARFPGGVLTIPHSKGKWVKWVYVKKLLDAIELRRAIEERLGNTQ